MLDPGTIVHHDGGAQGRFEAWVDGGRVELDWRRDTERLEFHHTGTSPALRGRGLAAGIVAHAMAWAAPQGLQLVPSCSYVAVWLRREPRWQRLLAPGGAQQVLNFWFGPLASADDGQMRGEWFRKNADFDAEVRARFGARIDAALAGGLRDWFGEPWGRLAYVILLDQLTRNAHRDTPAAFAGDAFALPEALALLDAGVAFEPLAQWFALMPLEHAEDLGVQQRGVAAFEQLAARDARLAGALDYACRHLDVIARFGRFPHRNAILGRASTAEELAYLATPGAGF